MTILDRSKLIIKRKGALYPHWEVDGGTYFATYILGDSISKSVADAYRFERENIIKTAVQMNRKLTEHEHIKLHKLYSERIDTFLDAGVGECYLRQPEIAQIVRDSFYFFNKERYDLITWCIMPNHVHIVFRILDKFDLETILHSWKSFTSTAANIKLGRKGVFWQREYYDHLIRNEKEFYRIVEYVLDNPIKAGLKDWQWVELCSR